MKFNSPQTLEQIATLIGASYVGAADFPVLGMNEIHVVQPGDIVFVDHPKYYDKALQSKATIILINKEVPCPEGKALLISDDPFRDFNKLTRHFNPFQQAQNSIAHTAKIGEGTIVQPNVFIGNHVKIGKNCILHPNVVIYDNAVIGDNVIIHAGTVVGSDAFYYKNRSTHFDRLLSGGNVVIEDDVEIGSLCTIDRGVTASTIIGKGSKLDNQVHVGHDTVIGKQCLIASQVGISGCVVIEDKVTIWGQVGVTSGITIGSKSELLAQSGISKSVSENKRYFGSPATDARQKFKEIAAIRALPEFIENMKKKNE